MIAVFTGDGVAKIGCWDDEEDPKCPDYAIRPGPDGHTYSINEGRQSGHFHRSSPWHASRGGRPLTQPSADDDLYAEK